MAYSYKYNKNKQDYDKEYVRQHFDRVEAQLPKGYKDRLKAEATRQGISVNILIKQLIDKGLTD